MPMKSMVLITSHPYRIHPHGGVTKKLICFVPGELHTIFDEIGQLTKQFKARSLSEGDFRNHYSICKDVFEKWIIQHIGTVSEQSGLMKGMQKQISDLSNEMKDLQQQVCHLSDEQILWERDGREWAIEKGGLDAEREVLFAKLTATEEECHALRLERQRYQERFEDVVRSRNALQAQSQELQRKISIPSPPTLGVCLSTHSHEILQQMLDEQNLYVPDLV